METEQDSGADGVGPPIDGHEDSAVEYEVTENEGTFSWTVRISGRAVASGRERTSVMARAAAIAAAIRIKRK